MKICYQFFASTRYWSDPQQLQQTYAAIRAQLVPFDIESHLVLDNGLLEETGDILVAIPMSGAVQQPILQTAAQYRQVVLYAGYKKGNTLPEAEDGMLVRNAAPTLMDCWGVLRRTHPDVFLATNAKALQNILQVLQAAHAIRGSKLLLIGETEPWVISVSRDLARYAELGVKVEKVPQAELAEFYQMTDFSECLEISSHFLENAQLREPSETDFQNACRMAKALIKLLEKHQADGAAVACFNLLQTGTTCCLGLSYINDETRMVAACEGDLDSAFTMLMLKKLGIRRVWMANPALCPGTTVQFSHCTGPVWKEKGWTLRSHHESGIGVSIQSPLPEGTVTACRVSAETGSATVQTGKSSLGERLPVCRSQMYVDFEQPEHYLETALGCHQIFAFEDCAAKMKILSRLLGLKIES